MTAAAEKLGKLGCIYTLIRAKRSLAGLILLFTDRYTDLDALYLPCERSQCLALLIL